MTRINPLAWCGGTMLVAGAAALAGVPAWILVGFGAGILALGIRALMMPRSEPKPAIVSPAASKPAPPAPDLAGLGLEQAGVPLLIFDAQSRLVSCNAAARTAIAPGGRRILGRPLDEVLTPRAILGVCETALSLRETRRGEVEWVGPDGPRASVAIAAPLPGGGMVLTLHDVTEQANAAQARADFAANASHELRTPVAAIKLAIETITGGAADDPAMRERLISMIAGNVSRLEEVLADLLDLSRAESARAPIESIPMDVGVLARSVVEAFEPAARERGLRLKVEVGPGLDAFRSDARLLRLILRNLVDNAVKFAYEGTEVWVRAARREGGARVEVIDKGVGIPLEDQPRIFERYFQVDRARTGSPAARGTGLGLAIARHAAERLGGTIRVSSVWKQGTTMTVEFPEADDGSSPSSGG